MSEPFIGEIRIFGFNYAPRGWAMCNGQLIPISQNTALFALLGTYYGGDGRTTFGLPNLQGSAPLDQGQGPGLTQRVIGETGGETNVTLITSEMASHGHTVGADSGASSVAAPTNGMWASAGRGRPSAYSSNAPSAAMSPAAVGPSGSNQPHNNMPPYLVMNFCIALQGVFPSRN
ncbi:MAG: phage tail protein [Kouleothrix sp.]|nr:phage tail protein [Kouleothrix sp.]